MRISDWSSDVCSSDLVTDESSCAAAVGAAVSAFGGVDVLVNNAFADGNHRSFEESLLEEWRATMEVNLWGPLQMTKAVVPVDRKSVESGKSVSVRVGLGGRRMINKKKQIMNIPKNMIIDG